MEDYEDEEFKEKDPMPSPTLVTRFIGKVVRIEPDGFGIIEFDNPIGPNSNTIGIVTSSTAATSPLTSLHPGVRVEGLAEADERNAASIKTFQLILPSA